MLSNSAQFITARAIPSPCCVAELERVRRGHGSDGISLYLPEHSGLWQFRGIPFPGDRVRSLPLSIRETTCGGPLATVRQPRDRPTCRRYAIAVWSFLR